MCLQTLWFGGLRVKSSTRGTGRGAQGSKSREGVWTRTRGNGQDANVCSVFSLQICMIVSPCGGFLECFSTLLATLHCADYSLWLHIETNLGTRGWNSRCM